MLEDRKLDTADVAQRWKVSHAHVRRLARKGALPSTKIGRVLRFDLADVVAFERAHRNEPKPAPRSRRGGSRRA